MAGTQVAMILVCAMFVLAGCAGASSVATTAITPPACQLVQPRELPSGAPVGEPARMADGRYVWGSGRDRIVEAVGELAVLPATSGVVGLPEGDWTRISVRGADGVIIPIGDPGVGEIAIEWLAAGCSYTIWLAPGATIEEVVTYAGRF